MTNKVIRWFLFQLFSLCISWLVPPFVVVVPHQGNIVVHVGHLLIWRDPDKTDPRSQHTEDVPAQETQPKDKQFPLVAIHQLSAHRHVVEVAAFSIAPLLLDILIDVECLRVGKGLDDPRNNQQQRPKKDQNPLNNVEDEDRQDVLAGNGLKGRLER